MTLEKYRAEVEGTLLTHKGDNPVWGMTVKVDDGEIVKQFREIIDAGKIPVISFTFVSTKKIIALTKGGFPSTKPILTWVDATDSVVEWEYDFCVKYPNIGKKGRLRVVRTVKGEYQENVLDLEKDNVVFLGNPLLRDEDFYKRYLKEFDI